MISEADPHDQANTFEHQQIMRLMGAFLVVLFLGLGVVSAIGLVMVSRLSVSPRDVFAEVQLLQKELEVSPKDVFAEVRRVQQQLDELERARSDGELVMRVLEAQGAAIVALDTSGRITLWSHGAERFFGHDRADAIGYGVAFLIPSGMRDQHRDAFDAKMLGSGEPFFLSVECDAKHQDGSLMPVTINVWGVPGGSAVAVFTRRGTDESTSP